MELGIRTALHLRLLLPTNSCDPLSWKWFVGKANIGKANVRKADVGKALVGKARVGKAWIWEFPLEV